jgi:hypothetical protein
MCGGPVRVQKTVERAGVTLEHGAFRARESVYVCSNGCRPGRRKHATHRAPCLAQRIPAGHSVGYDVIAYVGRARFVRYCQREEIRESLQRVYGISLSTGEISDLCRDFLAYIERLHEARAAALAAALAADGGWPLHIDATGEQGRGTLLVALAGWRRWVVGAWKIPTERADAILPRLLTVTEKFGAPCAIVRDLGRAMTEASRELVRLLGKRIPVLACHQHFLGDVGRDLLEGGHDRIRCLIRQFKVRAGLAALARDLGRALGPELAAGREALRVWQGEAEGGVELPKGAAGLACVRGLAQWVLDLGAQGKERGFPYDRPYLDLYERGLDARQAVTAFLRRSPESTAVEKALRRLARVLDPLEQEPGFAREARGLKMRAALFDRLRGALRLEPKPHVRDTVTPTTAPVPETATELRGIRAAVRRLRAWLTRTRPERGPADDRRAAIDLILRHLKDHGRYLWGHEIQLAGASAGGSRMVDRTNNIEEGLFRQMKQGERRRSGRKSLTQDLEQLPAAAALAVNLTCPDYVELLCGSLDELPHAFARLDREKRERESAGMVGCREIVGDDVSAGDLISASLPTADRRLVRTEAMRARVLAVAGRHTQALAVGRG